jgi:glycosyltransferase involved in cell wall biosynthesis
MSARNRSERETNLAAMWRFGVEDDTCAPTVFGSRVVQQAFLPQVLRHSSIQRCTVLASPFDQPSLQRAMNRIVQSEPSKVRNVDVRSTTSLLTDSAWLAGVTAWHDIGNRWQFAAELRWARAATPFPITSTCHAFGYRDQLHDLYTRMLLLDLRPYDAQICTSRAARVSFQRILEGVTFELNEAHGTRLAYPGRIETIPLGVDTGVFRPGDKKALRAQLGLPADALVLLWFGRLSYVDKADLLPLITVFRELVRSNRRRRLLLVLAGSSIAACATILERYCVDLELSDRVRILSPYPGPDRAKLLAAADIFVSPGDSIQEAFGQTPLEAMACGIPQVVSDWDGYRDTVVDGETGYLVPTYWAPCDRDIARTPLLDWDLLDHCMLSQCLVVDVARLQARLQALVADEGLRRRLGEASRRRALVHFDWSAVVKRYDALWLELAAEAARTRWRSDPSRRNLRSPLFRAFRGYASQLLDDSTPVRLTAQGRAVRDGRAPLPAYFFAAAQALQVDAVTEALSGVGRSGATLGSVAGALARPGWHPDHARRHVLWLLKQGFAEAIGPRQRRGTARNLKARVRRDA